MMKRKNTRWETAQANRKSASGAPGSLDTSRSPAERDALRAQEMSNTMRSTADRAFTKNRDEAIHLCNEILAAIEKNESNNPNHPNWGHVGSMGELVKQLRHAGHWAGVAGCVEE